MSKPYINNAQEINEHILTNVDCANIFNISKMLTSFHEPGIPGLIELVEGYSLQYMIITGRFKNCVEIGSMYGRSAYFICKGLNMSNAIAPKLICIDSTFDTIFHFDNVNFPDNPQWSIGEEYVSPNQWAWPKGLLEYKDEDSNWCKIYNEFLDNPDNQYTTRGDIFKITMDRFPFMHEYITMHPGTIDTIDFGDEKFDFVFIDGDHSYDGVKNDFDKIYPYLDKHAVIAFHDFEYFEDVHLFVMGLLKDHPEHPRILNHLGTVGNNVCFTMLMAD